MTSFVISFFQNYHNNVRYDILEQYEVISYDVNTESSQAENGTMTVLGEMPQKYIGAFITIDINSDRFVLRIESIESGDEKTTTIAVGDRFSALYGFSGCMIDYVAGQETYTLTGEQCNCALGFCYTYMKSRLAVTDPWFWGKHGTGSCATSSFRGLECYNSGSGGQANYETANAWFTSLGITTDEVSQFRNSRLAGTSDNKLIVSIRNDQFVRAIQSRGYNVLPVINESRDKEDRHDLLIVNIPEDMMPTAFIPFNDGHATLISQSFKQDNVTSVSIFCDGTSWYPGLNGTSPGATYKEIYRLLEDGTVERVSNQDVPLSGTPALGYETQIDVDEDDTSATILAKVQAVFDKNNESHNIEFTSDKEYHVGQPVILGLKTGNFTSVISKVRRTSADDVWHYTCGDLPTSVVDHIKAQNWKYGQKLPSNPRKGQLVIV